MKWIKKPFIILGIGVGVGVMTCVVHLLYRKNKEEIVRTTVSRVTRTMKIPKGFVGYVLGRGGATIKLIREKTKARINFEDQGPDFTIAMVSGTPEEVEEAVNEINQIINGRPATVTKEIFISENITDSVWRNVNCIRQICDATRAKITFDFAPSKNRDPSVKIVIKGRKEEVGAAMDFIDELVAEVEVNASKTVHVAGRALPDSLPLHPTGVLGKVLPCEKLIPNSSDGYIEIYVSAVDNPSKFWVQISGSKSIQLDKLATEMTDFYNEEKNKNKLNLNNIKIGDVIAAFCEDDSCWYRAQVVKLSDKQNQQTEKEISVFYLDFGDCAVLNPSFVSALKPDFLSIPFQAIECCLADVEPVGEEWSPEATEEFEKMVHLGQWKVIMAKPFKKPIQNGEIPHEDTIQLVQLLDTITERDINISVELVSKGFAKFM